MNNNNARKYNDKIKKKMQENTRMKLKENVFIDLERFYVQ